MKTNIVLVGFLNNLTKQIGNKLALDLDLYYADAEEMLEYNLMNEKEIKKLCGADYLNGLKHKVLKNISTYENTLITIPYSIFSNSDNAEMFKQHCTIVFLNFTKEQLTSYYEQTQDKKLKKEGKVFLLAYEERVKFCQQNSDITIDISKLDEEAIYKKIRKELDAYYL